MNGETYVMFVTEAGGIFKTIRCTEDDYEGWKSERRIWYWGDRDPESGTPYEWTPYYMALARVEDNYDFGLGKPR